GYVGVAFFGLCTGIALFRLFTVRAAVVTMTAEGIRDTRIAPEFIPWTAVRGIFTWQFQLQKVMVLVVDPAVEARLTLTRMARWSRGPNRALGAGGLCITAQGLKINFATLLRTARSFKSGIRNRRMG